MPRDSRFPHMCRAVPLSSSVFPAASALPAPTGHLPRKGKALPVVMLFPHMRVFALTLWRKRYSRIVAFPIEEGGPRQRCSGAFVNCRFEMHFLALFHPARTLSGSLRSPPSPRGEGCRYEGNLPPANLRASPHIYLRRSRHHNPEPRTLKSLVKQNPLTRPFSSCIITSVVVMNYVY